MLTGDTERLTHLSNEGRLLSGDAPTKEWPLHHAFYKARQRVGAVVHLHSTYATLRSCRSDIDPEDAIPPLTPYVVMRVGRVPVIPYCVPGSAEIVPSILARAARHPAILIANHGPVVAAGTLEAAVFAMEELEETARLVHLAQGVPARLLHEEQIADLCQKFPIL